MPDSIDDAFSAALNADAGVTQAEIPAPPRRSVVVDPDAPHGRGEDGEPLAPYGLNKKTGKPNRTQAGPGRPSKNEQPRTAPTQLAPAAAAAAKDYSQGISELLDGTWMLLSSAPVPVEKIKVKVRAQAALINGNKPGLVKGLNLLAQNNEVIGNGVEKLTSGGASWVLPAMFALGPFVAQSAMMWRAPVAGDVEKLAAANDVAWDETVKAMTGAMAEAMAEAEQAAA